MERHGKFLFLALVTAGLASVISLALSQVLGLVPCELCWYQRLLLYPQVLLLGVAIRKPHRTLPLIAFVLSLGGVGVSTYHSWVQLQSTAGDTCSLANPCSTVTLEIAGLSIPNLSLLTFLLLSGLLVFETWGLSRG